MRHKAFEQVRPAEIEANKQNHLAGAQDGGGEGNEKLLWLRPGRLVILRYLVRIS